MVVLKRDMIFYGNTKDDTHCYQACIRIVLKAIFPKKEFSFEELDKLTNKPKGKWTWYPASLVSLDNMGLTVKLYSMFNYKRFSIEGEKYLYDSFSKDDADIIIKNSDVSSAVKDTKKMLKKGIFHKKSMNFKDVENFFKKDYFIILWVNSRLLNRFNGFVGHFVVLIGFDKNYVYIHDPGRPPRPNRKVLKKHFLKAWKYNTKCGDILLIKKPE